MSDAIARVRAHYDSIAPKVIIVPEWDNLEIHATSVTLSEQSRIYSNAKEEDVYSSVIEVLIVKAKDAEGKALFTIADRPALLHHSDPAVVVRVASEILNNTTPKAAELGK